MKYSKLIATGFLNFVSLPALAHDHYAAGVLDTNANGLPDAGESLCLIGPDLSARIFHLLARPVGQGGGGYYQLNENARSLFPLDSFSFTALSDGQAETGDFRNAHTGTEIWMEVVAVTGPAGGSFGFWETGRATDHETPTISFKTDQATAGFAFQISEPLSWVLASDQDPFGHIHGRTWTADRPGDYFVSYRLVDRSTNRPGGDPWHTPSQIYQFHYKAGPNFQPLAVRVAGACVLTWSSQMGVWASYQAGVTFQVLRSTNLTSGAWTVIGSVTGTTAETVTFTDLDPPAGQAFYRLSFDWSVR